MYSFDQTASNLLVESLAIFSTRLIPASASVLSLEVAELPTICKIVPFDADPVPAANGNTAATRYICQPSRTKEQSRVRIPSAINENLVYVRSNLNVCSFLWDLPSSASDSWGDVDSVCLASRGSRSCGLGPSTLLAWHASSSFLVVSRLPIEISFGKANVKKTPLSMEYMKISQPFSLVANPKTSVEYNWSKVGR